eukprot:499463_1
MRWYGDQVMFGLCRLAGWFVFDLYSFCYIPYTLFVLCPCNALLDRFFVFCTFTITQRIFVHNFCCFGCNQPLFAFMKRCAYRIIFITPCCNFAAHSVKINCIAVISVWCFTLHLFNTD